MMSYRTFLANVFSLSEWIASDKPNRQWVNGETGLSSVVNPEEFFEMALGDDDLENMISHFSADLKSENAYDAVSAYRDALLKLETLFDSDPRIEPRRLLASSEWLKLCSAAREVVALPAAQTAFHTCTRSG